MFDPVYFRKLTKERVTMFDPIRRFFENGRKKGLRLRSSGGIIDYVRLVALCLVALSLVFEMGDF